MEDFDARQFCTHYDVVFLGGSITNLLSAIALIERFEGIKIRVLTSYDSVQRVGEFATAVSQSSQKGLRDVSPDLPNILGNQHHIQDKSHQEENPSVVLQMKELYGVLISRIPQTCLVSDWSIRSMHQYADVIEFELESGEKHFTKLMVEDSSRFASETVSEFCETAFVVSTPPSQSFNNWTNDEICISPHWLSSGVGVVSCLSPTSVSLENLERRLESQNLMNAMLSGQVESVHRRELQKLALVPAQGRYARSSETGAFIPYISSLKLEHEIEEALLLRKSILLKGLTAAALSDWKRRKSNSTMTQDLLLLSSPLGLSLYPKTKVSSMSLMTRDEKRKLNEDIGKPLVYSPEKRTMIWHIAD